jgi:DUF1680 family protein
MTTLRPVLFTLATAAFAQTLQPVPPGQVKLLDSQFLQRAKLNRNYVVSLKNENLLQNFYLEAGLWNPQLRLDTAANRAEAEGIHWGWEAPTCQLRGHFLGHWLSAAAFIATSAGDSEVRGKADAIVSELARIQEKNGGRWAASIPEKYFFWIAQGKPVWAPHYTVHKTFMGLIDMYKLTGNRQALDVAEKLASWFDEWTKPFTRDQMDDILDVETGGMLEVWADLYGITKKPVYLELMSRYRRGRLFDALLAGKDVLTNKHANTTIPEAQGAARAYEVTGDTHWRDIAMAYWKAAVTDRGYYATGGQTSGEIWTAPFKLSARLGDKNQEHCVVYNMIRLADYLYRWTGDMQYLDYIERNIYNGILAQQHPATGQITYFLPMEVGAKKTWGTPTNDFWCCHGSLVQAQSRHDRYIYYTDAAAVTVAQYIPSEATVQRGDDSVKISQTFFNEADDHRLHRTVDPADRPNRWVVDIRITSAKPADFALRLRIPWWVQGPPTLTINGKQEPVSAKPSTFLTLKRAWSGDHLRLTLPKGLASVPLPDRNDRVAFMDGPVVLAGLTAEDRPLAGDKAKPETILMPDNEREWSVWLEGNYRAATQNGDVRFVPLYSVTDQRYTLYFPVR